MKLLIRLMLKIGSHPNIIRFLGVTRSQDPMAKKMNYSLVLEFADNGTLGEYLKKNSNNLEWKDQLKFAKELASAISCLHENGILHRNLHSKSILVHYDKATQQDTVKLAGFGLSRQLQQSTHYTSNIYGVLAYMEPTTLKTEQNHKLTKKSDIYSLGVIFWELTSGGLPPFKSENEDCLVHKILEGIREKPIPNTNGKFVELYQNCWKPIPDERPNIQGVMDVLNNINSENIPDIMVTKPPNENEPTISYTDKPTESSEWFENAINNEEFSYYDYQDFDCVYFIGAGAFATVYSAKLKNASSDTFYTFAIKRFYDKPTMNEVIDEILLMRIGSHPNIIRFCGVTKLEDPFTKKMSYSLVLEYANNGTLQEYLKKNSENFKWKKQLTFAKEIASAILFLHKNGILHRDLHSKNILVHHDQATQEDTVKLADFGLSRRLQKSTHYTSNIYGVLAYMEPTTLTLTKTKQNHKLTKKSDIYSLGVIFWELTSGGLRPFESENEKSLVHKILEGTREKPIPNTNGKFVKLYQNCWKRIPGERPNIQEVIDILNNIKFENIHQN